MLRQWLILELPLIIVVHVYIAHAVQFLTWCLVVMWPSCWCGCIVMFVFYAHCVLNNRKLIIIVSCACFFFVVCLGVFDLAVVCAVLCVGVSVYLKGICELAHAWWRTLAIAHWPAWSAFRRILLHCSPVRKKGVHHARTIKGATKSTNVLPWCLDGGRGATCDEITWRVFWMSVQHDSNGEQNWAFWADAQTHTHKYREHCSLTQIHPLIKQMINTLYVSAIRFQNSQDLEVYMLYFWIQ